MTKTAEFLLLKADNNDHMRKLALSNCERVSADAKGTHYTFGDGSVLHAHPDGSATYD